MKKTLFRSKCSDKAKLAAFTLLVRTFGPSQGIKNVHVYTHACAHAHTHCLLFKADQSGSEPFENVPNSMTLWEQFFSNKDKREGKGTENREKRMVNHLQPHGNYSSFGSNELHP